jgi:heme/copper-type cytochrome/quinol oxidase subunit 1
MKSMKDRKTGLIVTVRWTLYAIFAIVGVFILYVIGCFMYSWGQSILRHDQLYRRFIFGGDYTISNVFGILSTLIAFITLVVGVGAFFGYASLKDVAERKAAEVAEKVAKDVSSGENFTERVISGLKEQQKKQFEQNNSVSMTDKNEAVRVASFDDLSKVKLKEEE